ncbi:MAG: efflux RND transporter periplasmic adaptor subunit [Candidatus Palauibacterales bacterium]|nr:efflux RND transporter periplasmic adaptor subunit [Candidatus Palauibacterales bacterium]
MTRSTHRSIGALAAGLAAAVVAAGCAGSSGSAAEEQSGAAGDSISAARIVDVETRAVRPDTFVDRLHMTGTVEAERTVDLTAQESGRVRELPAEKGTRLEAGAPIAEIDARELRAQLEEARARAELAREQWERRRELYEEKNAISELDYLEARSQADQASARVERLEARLDDKTIEAPFTGVLDERPVEVGTTVSPGQSVATLVDLRPVKVSAGVPERYANDVSVGDSAAVTVPSLNDGTFRGELTYVGAAVGEDSRTLPVEIELPNVDGRLKPRMVADVSMVRRRWSGAISVPQDAVLRTSDGFAVYVIEETEAGSVARRRAVQLGPRESDRVLVESGLEAGDRLVTVGQQQLADGDRVRLAESQ